MGFRNYSPGKRDYGPLPWDLAARLLHVPCSTDRQLQYRPCAVTLRDGTVEPNVYVVDAQAYIDSWGIWPEDDKGKRAILSTDVSALDPSPNRLPHEIANKIYRGGESGMGYTVFKLQFKDGSTQAYLSGNAVDFIAYPPGKTAADVAAVEPHRGRGEQPRQAPSYAWLLHGAGEGRGVLQRFE